MDRLFKIGQKIEIWIDRLSSGGRGVGRYDGVVVFVQDSAPQERALVEIIAVKKNFAEARLVQVLEASPHRIAPPCPIAHVCGGCSWQHVSYEEQLMQKQDLVRDALAKFAGLKNAPLEPTRPSPSTFRYRSRIQVHYQDGSLGFFRKGSHSVIEATDCLIAQANLTAQFATLKERLVHEKSGACRVEIMETESGSIKMSTESRYSDEVGFAQVNTGQNQNLIDYVLDQICSDCRLLFDFYAGAGNFSLPIARAFRRQTEIHAVELHSQSIQIGRARHMTEAHGKIEFHEAKVEHFLASLLDVFISKPKRSAPRQNLDGGKELRTSFPEATVLLDPPRAGCAPSVIENLIRLDPREVIYVSCHPVTLARDLKLLAGHYEVIKITPFDMFPQTDHVEVVATLRRCNFHS